MIEGVLGRGGMGVVFRARDPELGRFVALKVVRRRHLEGPLGEQFGLRLRREAQALARLHHDNVVGLYDLGTTDHAIFLAMELVEGLPLSSWLARTSPSWREVLEVYVQAGRGLSAAHAAGIVHRDFKPTNAIASDDGHVTVVDFGLARGIVERTEDGPADQPADADTRPDAKAGTPTPAPLLLERLTNTNVIIGTRGYMSPEQLLGLPVGPRSDQFSFCVALHEALYGLRPYPGRNAVETARAFAAGYRLEPTTTRGVPPRVHRALLRGLSVEPTLRFESMDELLAALDPPPTHRLRRLAVTAALVLTAAGSAMATAYVERLRPEVAAAAALDPEVSYRGMPPEDGTAEEDLSAAAIAATSAP